MPDNTTFKNASYHGSPSNKVLGTVLIIIAIVISAYTSVYIWVNKRTIFEKFTFKPITEEVASENAATVITSIPTKLLVISGSDRDTIPVPAGSSIKVLGAYMKMLSLRPDFDWDDCAPWVYSPEQYFMIELANGAKGAALLPEALVGRKIVIQEGDQKGETLTVRDVRKNNSNDKYPYDYYVEGSGNAYKWDEFECVNTDVEKMVVYSYPMGRKSEDEIHKDVYGFLSFMKLPVPTHSNNGYFLFPRYKNWNMYKIRSWWRGRFMVSVYWFILLAIVLWRLGALSVRVSTKADRKFIENASLDNKEAYLKIVHYYWPRYFIPAFIVGCIFSPLVWLWTKIYRKSIMEVLHKELESERCPKCRKLGLKKEFTGKVTPERFVRTVYTEAHTHTTYKDDVGSPKVLDPDTGEKRYRQIITTTSYAAGSHDVYAYEKEFVVCCEKCKAIVQTGWDTVSRTCNYKGGEVLRESTSKEAVKTVYVKKES